VEKDKKLKILLPVLFVIMVFVWARALKGPASKRRVKKGITGLQVIPDQDNLMSLAKSPLGKRARTSYEDWGRNPFVLHVQQALEAIRLQGIIWDKENPTAIIGDNIVGIGDKIDSKTVVDIKQDHVILNDGTKDIELR